MMLLPTSIATNASNNNQPTKHVVTRNQKSNKKKVAGTSLNDMFIAVFGIGFILSLSLNIMHMWNGMDNGTTVVVSSSEGSAIHRAIQDFKSGNGDNNSNNRKRTRTNTQQQQQQVLPPPKKIDETTIRQQVMIMAQSNVTQKKSQPLSVNKELVATGKEEEEEKEEDEYNKNHDDLPPEIRLGQQQQQQQREDAPHDQDTNNNDNRSLLATLNCQAWGGPSVDVAQEMVYWQHIPSDSNYASPFYKKNIPKHKQASSHTTKYLTFEPDGGGW